MRIGLRIKAYRRKSGLIQAALAHQLGVDVTTVSRWERGLVEPEAGVRRRLEILMNDPLTMTDGGIITLMSAMNTPTALLSQDLKMVMCNDDLTKLTEGASAEGVGKHIFHSWPEGKIKNAEKYADEFASGFMSEPLTLRELNLVRPPDGSPFLMRGLSSYIPIIGGDRKRYLISTVKNTSRRS